MNGAPCRMRCIAGLRVGDVRSIPKSAKPASCKKSHRTDSDRRQHRRLRLREATLVYLGHVAVRYVDVLTAPRLPTAAQEMHVGDRDEVIRRRVLHEPPFDLPDLRAHRAAECHA